MHTVSSNEPGPDLGHLTIGDLAERTGLSPATLRAWETRHGFPPALRRDSGHRRYEESTVEVVREVVRRRDGGTRLDVAIADALARLADPAPPARSVFAELRREHPRLAVHRLRKSTLLALSWAIEDEFCARACEPRLFGAFQREGYYQAAEARWTELARVSRSTLVCADFPSLHSPDAPRRGRPLRVPLPEDSPMRREWGLVCDSPDLPAALTAWEVPGQDVRDRDRVFEAIWTVDPAAVRTAARASASIAADTTPAGAEALYALADAPPAGTTDLAAVTEMFNRVVAYVDRYAVR